MSMQLRIKMNENLWSKDEREILIKQAFEIYLQKCCKMTLKATDTEIKTGHHRRASYEGDFKLAGETRRVWKWCWRLKDTQNMAENN